MYYCILNHFAQKKINTKKNLLLTFHWHVGNYSSCKSKLSSSLLDSQSSEKSYPITESTSGFQSSAVETLVRNINSISKKKKCNIYIFIMRLPVKLSSTYLFFQKMYSSFGIYRLRDRLNPRKNLKYAF